MAAFVDSVASKGLLERLPVSLEIKVPAEALVVEYSALDWPRTFHSPL